MIVPQQENPLQPRQSPLASTGSIFKIGEVTTYTPATIDAPASFRVIFQSKQDDFDMDFPTSLYQEARNRYVHLLNLCRLLFIPEGVGPASGMLQSIVRDIFNYEDFQDWTIVIFDNFLILADDYEDAANKLERVIARCAEFGVILKMKKSFIGASKVTFFGYEVTHGEWKLSQTRKDAITAMPFPTTKKEMQSFLGAALFFHSHIPDYSEWSAKLYETTHDGFSWDRTTWPPRTMNTDVFL